VLTEPPSLTEPSPNLGRAGGPSWAASSGNARAAAHRDRAGTELPMGFGVSLPHWPSLNLIEIDNLLCCDQDRLIKSLPNEVEVTRLV